MEGSECLKKEIHHGWVKKILVVCSNKEMIIEWNFLFTLKHKKANKQTLRLSQITGKEEGS